MDAGLYELIYHAEAETVEAIMRLNQTDQVPPEVEIVTQFGHIATCRIPHQQIQEVWAHETVASLKAARYVAFDPDPLSGPEELAQPDTDANEPAYESQEPMFPFTGKEVCVGIADWGFDFTHPHFRNADGSTRFLAIWDQSAEGDDPLLPYGYGVLYTREQLNEALLMEDPFAFLGYHPAKGDPLGDGAHGTHVLDIMAGNGRVGPCGMAPEANLIAVHLSAGRMSHLNTLGDSVRILEGIDFLDRTAGPQPLVINLSVGRHGGPHTGETLVEQGMDAFLASKPGRAIVQSSGNYYAARAHSAGTLGQGERAQLHWVVSAADRTPNELEVWYDGNDRFSVTVELPDGTDRFVAKPNHNLPILLNDEIVGRIYHRTSEPNTGKNHINVFLYPNAPAGMWPVSLEAQRIGNGTFHAWIERDAACFGCQSRFPHQESQSSHTTGTICNGRLTVAVGAVRQGERNVEMTTFSSSGPTIDGRTKPEVLACGSQILAARSMPASWPSDQVRPFLTRKSGTSMAAPRVAGSLALLFEAVGRPLNIADTRNYLFTGLDPFPALQEADSFRVGKGILNVKKMLQPFERPVSDSFVAQDILLYSLPLPLSEKHIMPTVEPNYTPELQSEGTDTSSPRLEPPYLTESTPVEDLVGENNPLQALLSNDPKELEKLFGQTRLGKLDKDLQASLARKLAGKEEPYFDDSLGVLALPGQTLPNIHPGDILLRNIPGESGLTFQSVLTGKGLLSAQEALNQGWQLDTLRSGLYTQVLENEPVQRSKDAPFARLVADAAGRLLPNRMLLRQVPDAEGVFTPDHPINMRFFHPPYPFNTAPNPVSSPSSSFFPEATNDPESAIEFAYKSVGLTDREIRRIKNRRGFRGVEPIARVFGAEALAELFQRLRYHHDRSTKRYFLNPPHAYSGRNTLADIRRVNPGINIQRTNELFAPRLLLTIPGHFRELARTSTDPFEAYTLENLGWLLMYKLRDDISRETGNEWWVPPKAIYVEAFPSVISSALNHQIRDLVLGQGLLNSTIGRAAIDSAFANWELTLAGQFWKAEMGQTTGQHPSMPFYPQLVSIPAKTTVMALVTPATNQIDRVWQDRVREVKRLFPVDASTRQALRIEHLKSRANSLRTCENHRTSSLGLVSNVSFQGLELAYHYPCLTNAARTNFWQEWRQALNAIHGVATALFNTFSLLGWNDLLFQVEGAGCFRGTKSAGRSVRAQQTSETLDQYEAFLKLVQQNASQISNHGYGKALDLHAFENPVGRSQELFDPRVVAAFEAYGFNWGKRFSDPHHFEYK